MSFLFPLGLLGLIGIPIIVFIYIIKSKYTEQTIASTYLWTLSERFLKKRKPISKLTGILTLILQLLAVLILSVAIARPVFVVGQSASDVYIVLDGSASMNMRKEEDSRFDIAKRRICDLIDEQSNGSTYSLVFVSDTAETVFEGVSNKEQAKIFVNNLTAGWTAADCADAMTKAQAYFDVNRSALLYLFTDKPYDVSDNLTLMDVSDNESNCALVEYGYDSDENGIRGVGKVVSYSADKQIVVEMWAAENITDQTVKIAETTVDAEENEPADFVVASDLSKFAKLELRIRGDDALAEDNVVILYDDNAAQDRKALIVSDIEDENDDAVYLASAIRYAGKADVDVISIQNYEQLGAIGYDMYVFNGYAPKTLPTNAAIWLVDAVDGNNNGSGITFRDYATPRDQSGPYSYYSPQYVEENKRGSVERLLLRDVVGRQVAVRTYAQYVTRNFTSVLSVNGDDLIFAGLNANNDRQVAFSFRIKDSNMGLTDDFLILARNLMDYSFPSVLDKSAYVCGEVMTVNVVSGCEGIVVTSPSGTSVTLDTVDSDVCEVTMAETGTYTLTVKLKGNDERNVYAYAAVPASESGNPQGGQIQIVGEREYELADGYYDDLLILFIAMAVLILADWGVYCYEQYQLR